MDETRCQHCEGSGATRYDVVDYPDDPATSLRLCERCASDYRAIGYALRAATRASVTVSATACGQRWRYDVTSPDDDQRYVGAKVNRTAQYIAERTGRSVSDARIAVLMAKTFGKGVRVGSVPARDDDAPRPDEAYQSTSARILRENMSGDVVWSPDRGWHDEGAEELPHEVYLVTCEHDDVMHHERPFTAWDDAADYARSVAHAPRNSTERTCYRVTYSLHSRPDDEPAWFRVWTLDLDGALRAAIDAVGDLGQVIEVTAAEDCNAFVQVLPTERLAGMFAALTMSSLAIARRVPQCIYCGEDVEEGKMVRRHHRGGLIHCACLREHLRASSDDVRDTAWQFYGEPFAWPREPSEAMQEAFRAHDAAQRGDRG